MTDKDTFLKMLDGAHTAYEVVPRDKYLVEHSENGCEYWPDEGVAVVVRVNPGYRAHFEATFDANGELLSIGQWESM